MSIEQGSWEKSGHVTKSMQNHFVSNKLQRCKVLDTVMIAATATTRLNQNTNYYHLYLYFSYYLASLIDDVVVAVMFSVNAVTKISPTLFQPVAT
jgi:hypothetical protein